MSTTEIDPSLPPMSTMVYLADSDLVFGIGLHFPRPYGEFHWFSFPVQENGLLDETAEMPKAGAKGSMCFQFRDKILAKMRQIAAHRPAAAEAISQTNWTSVAACIRSHMSTWNEKRRKVIQNWDRVISTSVH